jgi:hypothetical protein
VNVPKTVVVVAALWGGGFVGGVREAAAAQRAVGYLNIVDDRSAGPCYFDGQRWTCPLTSVSPTREGLLTIPGWNRFPPAE